MRNREWKAFLRNIEHVENNRLCAAVFAMMNRVDHFDHDIAFVHSFCLSVKADDSEFASHQHAMVHSIVVMPAEFLSCGNDVFNGNQFGFALWVVGEIDTIPTLVGAE